MDDSINEIPHIVKRTISKLRKMGKRKGKRVKKFAQNSVKFANRKEEGMKYMEAYKSNDGSTKQYFRGDTDDPSVLSKGEFFLAGACLNDLYITKLLDERIKRSLNIHQEEKDLVCDRKRWVQFVRETFDEKIWHTVEFSHNAGMIIDWERLCFLDYTANSNSVEVKVYGSKEDVKELMDLLLANFIVAACHVEWVYSSDGSSVDIALLGEKLPVSEMYPFLKDETIESYYDRFLNSNASILLLIGPPGTGKTTFIRGLLNHSQKNAIVTYDEGLLQKDYVFARFVEDEVSVMVIEDADNFLRSRTDGNSMMHRFLNVGDGLITVKGKKLIFSTNLPSVKDVDSALIRPGRCFDIVNFRNYTKDEAHKLAKVLNIDFSGDKDEYSLAEIFHQQTYVKPTTKVGFI